MRARLQRRVRDQALAVAAPNKAQGAGPQQPEGIAINTARRTTLLAIAAFTLATAAIHIVYAFPTLMFIASGVAYLVLLAAFFAPPLRRLRGAVGAALALLAVANIAAWYATGARIPLAYVDKAFEAGLLAALGMYVAVAPQRSRMPVRVAPGPRSR